jgi:hypothetical protein
VFAAPVAWQGLLEDAMLLVPHEISDLCDGWAAALDDRLGCGQADAKVI